MTNNFQKMPLPVLVPLLGKNIDADKAFARRITCNDTPYVSFFLDDFSKPILQYIVTRILKKNKATEDSVRNIFGDYYDFVSPPLDEKTRQPRWHKIALYAGKNNACLRTYVTQISSRHFCRIKKRQEKTENSRTELLDFFDYEALLRYDTAEEATDLSESPEYRLVMKAFGRLKERDREALYYLVMCKMNGLEAFEKLKKHLNPDGGKAVMDSWDNKRKQTAMSLLKGRALDHIWKEMQKIEKERTHEK